MVGLHYIKYAYNLSDEALMQMFVESAQWQYFVVWSITQTKRPVIAVL